MKAVNLDSIYQLYFQDVYRYLLTLGNDHFLAEDSEKKGMLFSKTVSEAHESPAVESYGSAALRDKNFMDTLQLLSENKKIATNLAGPDLQINKRIAYLDKHGVKIYGLVVTGPTKEILKLSRETWVTGMQLGEVRLWNWNNTN